jgi:21S rRNA (GM2251-2'-O)-methyltransferase
VLEASELPAPPVLSLAAPKTNGTVPLKLGSQSAEDAAVNGSPHQIFTANRSLRQPFVLMLDGILDPQNVGNILRTAYFYGVDAVAVSTNTCCPLNSATLAKASSGACEALQVLALPKPGNFAYASRLAGWTVVAAVAPAAPKSSEVSPRAVKKFWDDDNVESINSKAKHTQNPGHTASERHISHTDLAALREVTSKPVILMLGSEGEGLPASLKKRADVFVSIAAGPRPPLDIAGKPGNADIGLDSINVSTAAAVLVDSFLRIPAASKERMASVASPEGTVQHSVSIDNAADEDEIPNNNDDSTAEAVDAGRADSSS